MTFFYEKIIYEYARHTHRAQCLDLQFKLCKDTFSLDTIILVVDFTKNYTLQPQNEVQEKYYTSQQVSIFVHITFMHAHTSTKDNKKILRKHHFYINDDRSHSIEFVHGCFQLFYGDLANRGISYRQHIMRYGWDSNSYLRARARYGWDSNSYRTMLQRPTITSLSFLRSHSVFILERHLGWC